MRKEIFDPFPRIYFLTYTCSPSLLLGLSNRAALVRKDEGFFSTMKKQADFLNNICSIFPFVLEIEKYRYQKTIIWSLVQFQRGFCNRFSLY